MFGPWCQAASASLITTLQRDVVSFGSVLYACDRGGHWAAALGHPLEDSDSDCSRMIC